MNVDDIITQIPFFTPADIEYLFSKVRQAVFENEHVHGSDCRVDSKIFLETIGHMKPTLTEELVAEFEEDCEAYTHY